jgi:hypothetical protein
MHCEGRQDLPWKSEGGIIFYLLVTVYTLQFNIFKIVTRLTLFSRTFLFIGFTLIITFNWLRLVYVLTFPCFRPKSNIGYISRINVFGSWV